MKGYTSLKTEEAIKPRYISLSKEEMDRKKEPELKFMKIIQYKYFNIRYKICNILLLIF